MFVCVCVCAVARAKAAAAAAAEATVIAEFSLVMRGEESARTHHRPIHQCCVCTLHHLS